MKNKSIFLSALIGLGLYSCTPKEQVSVVDEIEKSIDSVKKAEGFDKNEDVFMWSIDTLENKEVVLTYKTTDTELAEKAKDAVKDYGLKVEVLSLPYGENLEKPFAVVNTSLANTRVTTSRARSMATQVLMGMQLEILDNDGKWYLVRTPQGYIAWIVKSSFEFLTKKESDSLKAKPKVMVTVPSTYAYNVEDNKKIVSDLVNGNVVVLTKQGKEWTEVLLPGNRKAVVKSSEVRELSEWQKTVKFDKDKLLEEALKHLGQPYLWGGNSFNGNDCSGFSASVYWTMGMLLPRDAYQQAAQGDPVEFRNDNGVAGFKNLEVGDLVFFDEPRITHVAVWIGNNEYIHNSSGYGRVYISSVDPEKENYSKSLAEDITAVKRINGSKNTAKIIDLTKTSIW